MNAFTQTNGALPVFLDETMLLQALKHPHEIPRDRIKIEIAKREKSYEWILWILFSIVAITTITAITVMPF